NWLENVQPRSAQDWTTVRESAIGVLHVTENAQLVLAMSHAVLRQVVNQIQSGSEVNPNELARRVFKGITDDLVDTANRSKMRAVQDVAGVMMHEEISTVQRQFLGQVYTLAGGALGRVSARKAPLGGVQGKSVAPKRAISTSGLQPRQPAR